VVGATGVYTKFDGPGRRGRRHPPSAPARGGDARDAARARVLTEFTLDRRRELLGRVVESLVPIAPNTKAAMRENPLGREGSSRAPLRPINPGL